MKENSVGSFRRLVVVAGVFLGLIMFTGAAVRLTSSGLGCEDWPTCNDEQLVPKWSFHGWIEFGNRLISGVVALSVIAVALGARRLHPKRPDLLRWSWSLIAVVMVQVVLGGITVKVELHPLFVSVHFLLSLLLLWQTAELWSRAVEHSPQTAKRTVLSDRQAVQRNLSGGLVGLITVVVVLGTLVTGTGPNGGDSRADRLDLDLGLIARIHSVSAWLFLAGVVGLAIHSARSNRGLGSWLQPILAATIIQGAVGYWQYFSGVPPLLVGLHVVGSVVLFVLVILHHLTGRNQINV